MHFGSFASLMQFWNAFVRAYLVGYILCIINYHICQNTFGRIDIMTNICIQRCLAPQDSCTLYISAERHNAIQPTNIHNLFFLHGHQSLVFFNPRSLPLPSSVPLPERSILTTPGAAPLVRRPILLIQPPLHRVKPSADRSSPSDRHRHWPPTQLHSHHRRRSRRHHIMLGCLSYIRQLPLRQIHFTDARSGRRHPIRQPPDPPTPITPLPHQSGHRCTDLPPSEP
jgi:hypothetical protein